MNGKSDEDISKIMEEDKIKSENYSFFLESIHHLDSINRAEKWLEYISNHLIEHWEDLEALIYCISRGIDLSQVIEREVKNMLIMEKDILDSFFKNHKSSKENFQLHNYSEFSIPNFWQNTCRLEENSIIDSIFLRTIEWCKIGLFNDWIDRFYGNSYRHLLSDGIEKNDARDYLFSLCRSNFALKYMQLPINRMIEVILCIDQGCDYPWQYYSRIQTKTGQKIEKICDLALAATIIFAHHQISKEIDFQNGQKIGSLLLQNQLNDGSWAFEENFPQGSFEPTCMILTAIIILKPHGWEYAVDKGKKWLVKNQNPGGFWYGAYLSSYLTVLVLDTLHLIEGDENLTFNFPKSYLVNQEKIQEIEKNDHIFKIALSFPGEYRAVVKKIADGLKTIYGEDSIFYDNYYEPQLARPDIDLLLQDIYYNRSELIVVFRCREYGEKEWCGLEWRSIRTHILEKKGSKLMLLKIGEGEIQGLLKIDGYIDVQEMSPEDIVKIIMKRYESKII